MSIAIIFGGRSCEHNVSVVTGVQILNAVRALDPLPIYIDKNGEWRTGELYDLEAAKEWKKLKKVYPRPGSQYLFSARGRKVAKIDAAVLCLHGHNGEDGCIQGLLEICGIPYTGSGVLASAVCMDKSAFKQFVKNEGIPTLPYTVFSRKEFNENIYKVADRLNEIGYPLIVKPACLGSSIGVGIARTEVELVEATRAAFEYDNRVITEKLLENFREFNCAALGEEGDVTVSEVEEPIGWKEFLSYKDKYAGAKSAAKRRYPADLPTEISEEIKRLTKLVFEKAGLSGVVRVDFMLSNDGTLYLNEVNTLPGSLAAYFFKRHGISEKEFVMRLVGIAERRKAAADRLVYSYNVPPIAGKDGK